MRFRLLSSTAGDERVALLNGDGSVRLTYGELRAQAARPVAERPGFSLFCIRNTVEHAALLLRLLEQGWAVALVRPGLEREAFDRLLDLYRPDLLIGASDLPQLDGYHPGDQPDMLLRTQPDASPVHPDLRILLATSGTTGSPKFVRLSEENVRSNAQAIAQVLHIAPDDVAVGHLPLHYSFGLSVLTSHLASGASVMLTEDGMTSPGFWAAVRQAECTSLSCVPSHIEMLARLSLERLKAPSLKAICQAGGRARPELLTQLHAAMSTRGGRLFVMYGQTEAAPRLTTLPHEAFVEKAGSVGPALPGGRFDIEPLDGAVETERSGRVVYHGPNVMMGYALRREDLAGDDEMNGRLVTGDLGYLDADGFLYLTGREARFAKVAGLRVGLDEVEAIVAQCAQCAAIDAGGKIVVVVVDPDEDDGVLAAIKARLDQRVALPMNSIELRRGEIPLLPNGKTDYATLKKVLGHA